eukprot:5610865-Pleurochrysis_carterae.AAC.1
MRSPFKWTVEELNFGLQVRSIACLKLGVTLALMFGSRLLTFQPERSLSSSLVCAGAVSACAPSREVLASGLPAQLARERGAVFQTRPR